MVEDEVKKAWEMLRKAKKGKSEEAQDKRAQVQREEKEEAEKPEKEEETLETSLIPEEKEEFSVLPGKAPSLEITGATQNLESTIGPFFGGGEEEKEEKVSYTAKKKQNDYFGKEEEEKQYQRPVIESAVEFAAPQMFRESDIVQMARMAAPRPEKVSSEREYVSMENVELKELEHEKLTRERRETVKKYKPQM